MMLIQKVNTFLFKVFAKKCKVYKINVYSFIELKIMIIQLELEFVCHVTTSKSESRQLAFLVPVSSEILENTGS